MKIIKVLMFFSRFLGFIEKANCTREKESRGTFFYDCKNIKNTEIKSINPFFFAYKCDHENNVQYTTKYFAKYDDPSYIYVTYIPVGCKNKNLIVPKVSYSYMNDYFSEIPVISDKKVIDGKTIIRFAIKNK